MATSSYLCTRRYPSAPATPTTTATGLPTPIPGTVLFLDRRAPAPGIKTANGVLLDFALPFGLQLVSLDWVTESESCLCF
jgi:hypothetical protein